MVQQATAQILSLGYDKYFSEHSYEFCPGRSCQQAIEEALVYLNEGYEWVIDLDIEKYFDTVNHDKLISILRERINDAKTLRLIRKFLQAGVMGNGLISPSKEGVPQGESGNTQTVEETEAHISKPSETEPNHRMWIHPRRNLQGREQQTRMVQKKRNVCSEFCNQSRDTWTQNKEPTRIGRPVAILFE